MRYDDEDRKVWLRRWDLVKLFFGAVLVDVDWDTDGPIEVSLFRPGLFRYSEFKTKRGQSDATPWRVKVGKDLNAYHSLEAEEELTDILRKHLQGGT